MTFGFDPAREFYDLKTEDGLTQLVEDLQPLVGHETWDEFDNEENGKILREAFGEKVSLSDARTIFDRLRRTNRILSNDDREEVAEVTPAATDDRPRGADGHVLSEHEIFYGSQSSLAIRERMRVDRVFAAFARARMAGEVTMADGAEPGTSTPTAHPALRKFAQAYNATPASQLKPIAGYVTVGNERFAVEKFKQLVSEAVATKLL